MADKKISALTGASTPLAGTEVLPIVQSGSTVKVSAANITAGRSVDMASFSAKQATANQNVFVQNTTALTAGNTASAWFGNGTTSFGANDRQWGMSAFVTAGATNTDLQVVYYNGTTYLTPFTFDSSSNLKVGTAAKGINFTANTPAAGMTSQLLNWYEEGTWTPTVTSGSGSITTYTVTSAKYTRIGRQVTVNANILIDTVGTANGAVIVTLPWSTASDSAVIGRENAVSGFILQGSIVTTNSGVMICYDGRSANGDIFVGGNGSRFLLSATYFV